MRPFACEVVTSGGARQRVALTEQVAENREHSLSRVAAKVGEMVRSRSAWKVLLWVVVSAFGAVAVGTIALKRGEPISAMWLVVAAVSTYAIGYRFYSRFISAKVLALDAQRATPAERFDDGRDFVPTNKWVVFGHHFAAIAGPGPLLGPVLAAQLGYLPGTIWILAGAVLGGCVQDFVILAFSMRRDGKSMGQMAKEEIG